MSVFYINGDFAAADVASVPARDLAILRGYGVFDFLRTYGGLPFQLGAHLRRLRRSAALIELGCPWDIEELGEIVSETLRRNSYPEAGIRIVLTGGDSPTGFLPTGNPRLLVMVTPAQDMDSSYYQRGAEVVTVEQARHLPQAKTINYIPGITAQIKAQKRNPKAVDAIYRLDGNVIEGTRSNTFIYKDGRWITPHEGLLLGVTRAEAIKLIEAEGELELRNITLEEYRAADEVILTSSNKEIMPVVKVDDVTIGDGAPGTQTKRLMRQWRAMTRSYAGAGHSSFQAPCRNVREW